MEFGRAYLTMTMDMFATPKVVSLRNAIGITIVMTTGA